MATETESGRGDSPLLQGCQCLLDFSVDRARGGSFIKKAYFALERPVGCCVERDAVAAQPSQSTDCVGCKVRLMRWWKKISGCFSRI